MDYEQSFEQTWKFAKDLGSHMSRRMREHNQKEGYEYEYVNYGGGMFYHDGAVYWTSDGSPVSPDNYIARELRRTGAIVGHAVGKK